MANDNDQMTLMENEPGTCPTAGCKCQHGMLKRVVYGFIVMTFGGLAALAMYPELADYAYPLMGKPSHTGFMGERPCSSDGACPAGSLHSNFPLLGSPESTDVPPESLESCCSETCLTSPTCCEDLPCSRKSTDEAPADALSAAESPAEDRSN